MEGLRLLYMKDDKELIHKQADAALYESKTKNRNRVTVVKG
ncbi:MAG: hypothetical protein U9Q40_09340 [Campylobacterota bacterium]|nr:hypothetical protein [Campylobacterota bacterium]